MNGRRTPYLLVGVGLLLSVALLGPTSAMAHCDGMDGPVVKAAQTALAAGDVNLVLIWVQKKDEAEIRKAFDQTLTVRKLSADAKQLADTWFFETLVRVHRAGEGFPYTGLQPAGRDLGPAIPAADKALETGSIDDVLKLLPEATHDGVREHFAKVMAKKKFNKDDVDAGREFVEAYVFFVHYVEGRYEGADHTAAGCGHMAAHTQPTHAEHEHAESAKAPDGGGAGHGHPSDAPAKAKEHAMLQIPAPLKAEHEELHAELVKATEAGGKIGEAARDVASVLHPHFVKEEEFALPPLGLLSAAAKGEIAPEMRRVLAMTDKLKAELPQMLAEHKAIVAALESLKTAATVERNEDVAHFAEKLVLHAQTEEQVMYPAAIVVGEYIKVRLGQ